MDDKKKIVLVGCGHANLQVLHALGKKRELLNVHIIVLNDVRSVPYSGMLPGYLMDSYEFEDFHFDLSDICKRYGAHFHCDIVTGLDFETKQVRTLKGQVFYYDYCSINLGSLPLSIHEGEVGKNIVYIKPISTFLNKIHDFQKINYSPKKVLVIGGGVAGFEVSVALSEIFKNASTTIIPGVQGFLVNQNKLARRLALNVLKERKISLLEGLSAHLQNDQVELSDGSVLTPDLCVAAVSASPPRQVLNDFLPVNDYLQVEGYPEVLAAGDCTNFQKRLLPKAGVFAVREGKILAENFIRMLSLERLKKYRPQKRYLVLMMSGREEAILSWGPFALRSKYLWYLKNNIDRRFMKKFR